MQSVLAVSQRALLDVLEPVAASPDQVVMKCKYALWFEKASSDDDLLDILTDQIAKFTKHEYQIVLVPDKDWFTVRKEFLQSHRDELLKRQKKSGIEEPEAEEPVQENNDEVVQKAKDLFGDAVNIKD